MLLVGRQPEIVALDAMLALAATGAGQTRLIIGEAGIGKSRLVSEGCTRAVQRGFTIVQGHCREGDRALPYAIGLALVQAAAAHIQPEQLGARLHPYADLERQRLSLELPLARFAPAETKRTIGLLFHQERVRDEFVDAIQAHTDGNPFFIEETLRALAAIGACLFPTSPLL